MKEYNRKDWQDQISRIVHIKAENVEIFGKTEENIDKLIPQAEKWLGMKSETISFEDTDDSSGWSPTFTVTNSTDSNYTYVGSSFTSAD